MKIYFDNVNFKATNGPNNYAQKLARKLTQLGHEIVRPTDVPDAQISFIQIVNRVAPTLLRLDGIYFNSDQDWEAQNAPIKAAYEEADAVTVQSKYDKGLIEHHFGKRVNTHVIRNGTCHDIIEQIEPMNVNALDPLLSKYDEYWMCASHWRPHKRLEDNIRYFEIHAPDNAALLVFGKIGNHQDMTNVVNLSSDRVFYVGEQSWPTLIATMKTCSTFIHLAWLDHCPNVVVDAIACNCHLICSTAGGTNELPRRLPQRTSWTEIKDEETFGPCELYNPPDLNFTSKNMKKRTSRILTNSIDSDLLKDAQEYEKILKRIVSNI